MLFLFSSRPGGLQDGAALMQTKNSARHPGEPAFYLFAQPGPLHACHGNLGPASQFDNMDCRLAAGESAILIAHGGDDNRLYDEARQDVTDAGLRLMKRIVEVNPQGGYNFFLAACDGARRHPGQQTTLLTALVRSTEAMAQQLLGGQITCWGYTASAGTLQLAAGVPMNYFGRHIYGTLTGQQGVEQHCGYDCQLTAQLQRLQNGQYVIIYFAPGLYPFAEVVQWARMGYQPPMSEKFPNLFATLKPTSCVILGGACPPPRSGDR
jgi:hypothetical protein